MKIQEEKINKLEAKTVKLEEDKNESNNKIKKLENEIKEIKEKLIPIKEEKDKEEKIDNIKESKIIKNNDDKILFQIQKLNLIYYIKYQEIVIIYQHFIIKLKINCLL